jgi:DNA-binding PadR family transcriptional regulator
MPRALTNAELLVMSALLRLDNHAYGVPIVDELERHQRRLSVATAYVVLNRLEADGLVASDVGEATPERGGKARRYFRVTPKGVREIRTLQRTLIQLWRGVPQLQGGTT